MDIVNKYYKEAVKGLKELFLDSEEKWYQYVLSLPAHLQAVYTISILDKQVLNGGFEQYFSNRYGIFAYLTVEWLHHIRAFKTANILEQAIKKVNYRKLSPKDFRREIFEGHNKKLNDCDLDLDACLETLDDEYYELFNHPVEEDLHKLLVDFLNKYD